MDEEDLQLRARWFRQARFGMFVTWGLHAQLGRAEWVMNNEKIPVPEYEQLARTWKPRVGAARRWARLARQAGMRYIVLITKHHDGFCLFDSRLTEYNAARCAPRRDLVAEFVEACQAEGLRVGLYYSIMDWHHPDGVRCKHDEAARERFVQYTHGQVRELCTNYGKIDILWFDIPWPLTAEEGRIADLQAMIRGLQPQILINDRSGLGGDFTTPELYGTQSLSSHAAGIWEACMPFNDVSWGYAPIDRNYKSAWFVVDMLRQCAEGGGNFLLNIGPAPDGSVPRPCVKTLRAVGRWLDRYGASIYEATDPWEHCGLVTGGFTRKGSSVYFHCNRWPGREIAIGGMVNRVVEARIVGGRTLALAQRGSRLLLRGLPRRPPSSISTVIELRVEGTPRQVRGLGYVLPEGDPWVR